MKVKIYGAGSIGNHLSQASRALGWSVDLCDISTEALARTRELIYPLRYGKWDQEINTFLNRDAPRGNYDLICIGTPPDLHIPLAIDAVQENPRAILIEKPICTPDLYGAQELVEKATKAGVSVFVGYDHVVGRATGIAIEVLSNSNIGNVISIDVEFREHWGGIFAAHPWLAGPWESYLGFWRRGGGASGEHSHAANLWQHFALSVGAGRITEVQATLDFISDDKVDYDRLCLMHFKTESGLVGRCVQDVVTHPPKKWARIQGTEGFVEWECSRQPGLDVVTSSNSGKVSAEQRISKTRPDDFIEELKHIQAALNSNPNNSPISLECGLNTMMVIAAAHLSHSSGRKVRIDYTKGYTENALGFA